MAEELEEDKVKYSMNNDRENLESEDFYFNESGLMIFTEKYHLKRGYCCENNCRHCPYGFKNK